MIANVKVNREGGQNESRESPCVYEWTKFSQVCKLIKNHHINQEAALKSRDAL